MERSFSYAIAKLAAHPARQECLNVGLIVFNEDRLDVRAGRSLEKVRAISAGLDTEAVRAAVLRLAELDKVVSVSGNLSYSERLTALQSLSPLELGPMGSFKSSTTEIYEQVVAKILTQLVEPEPAAVKKIGRRSRLLSSLKVALKRHRVLARKGEDLSTHRVVPGWSFAEGLTADLVLRNGSMHVIETVDAASDHTSLRKVVSDIAVSALVLEQARMVFGADSTSSKLVYHASAATESIAKPSLLAAQHQGAELINWASDEDRLRFVREISELATPFERKREAWINASKQSKLSLN